MKETLWNFANMMGDDMETNSFCGIQTYQTEGINDWSLSNKVVTVTPSRPEMPFQVRGQKGRILTSEEAEKLMKDQTLVSNFKQKKLESDAQKNWDLFYKRNSTNFFKDRHWTTREFEELKACREQNHLYHTERCKAFRCDLTKDSLLENIPADSVDVVTLIFVLSAIHPDKMQLALENIYKILKPGGSILFRDYGLYDHTMLRFKNGHKLGPNFYVRQDGTRSFFFSDEYVAQLLTAAGYEVHVNEYVFRETVNKKEGLCVPRVFLQCKFKKPDRNRIDLTC
ncbi:tRNA N(3)-methylcytidine methyltransferase METTL6-like isoform X3 [Hemiscyllium ocellatum]|uniref:tRNA N(3)-methylcytidine methyltransferase METTL6-like isoform X3 n=1 Tax=Hemiscyllium ocellatum TaxID=170820 RepID=UPI002966315C|nr:tRNA N(3)-methylcytidine methyltransferase METTL6-like isoform X3 [Hemiscyllium ocellatum]